MDPELLSHQFGSSVATVYLIELLKALNVPGLRWINENTTSINRGIGIMAAIAVSLGITFSSTGSFSTGGSLTIVYPSGHQLFEAAVHAAVQYGMQQGFFKAAVGKDSMGELLELLKKQAPAPAMEQPIK